MNKDFLISEENDMISYFRPIINKEYNIYSVHVYDDKDFDKITPLYEINENLFVKECSNGYYTDNLSKKGSIILYGKEPF